MSQYNATVWPPLELPVADPQPVGVYPPVSATVSPTVSASLEVEPQPVAVYPPAGNYVSPTSSAPLEGKVIPNIVNLPATGLEPVVATSVGVPASVTQQELSEYIHVYSGSQLPPTETVVAPGTNNTLFKIYSGPSW